MYQITRDGKTLAMTEAPNYIRRAENGCFTLCKEAEATGIAIAGKAYHILGRPDMAGAADTADSAGDDGFFRHSLFGHHK